MGLRGQFGRTENIVLTGIRSRTVQPVARWLYRLSYPDHCLILLVFYNVLETGRNFYYENEFGYAKFPRLWLFSHSQLIINMKILQQ